MNSSKETIRLRALALRASASSDQSVTSLCLRPQTWVHAVHAVQGSLAGPRLLSQLEDDCLGAVGAVLQREHVRIAAGGHCAAQALQLGIAPRYSCLAEHTGGLSSCLPLHFHVCDLFRAVEVMSQLQHTGDLLLLLGGQSQVSGCHCSRTLQGRGCWNAHPMHYSTQAARSRALPPAARTTRSSNAPG